MGTRETQRRAWREAVARAAWIYEVATSPDTWDDFRAALSAPKPWTRPAKADLGKWGANVRHFTPEHKAWVKRRGMWSSSKVDWRSLRRKRRAAQRRRR